jgi:NADPH-dependent 2,4-dienoyl-CoA reductase/sulfur reductase-like enzyme
MRHMAAGHGFHFLVPTRTGPVFLDVMAVPPRVGRKVAVVGGGPAGLSAAWDLGAAGVDVTIFEAMETGTPLKKSD